VEYIGATTIAYFELQICHIYLKTSVRTVNYYDSFDKLLERS